MNNFIYQSHLKDSKICDDIINFFNQKDTKKCQGKIGMGVNKLVKDSSDSIFNLSSNDYDWIIKYRQELIDILNQYEKKYLSICNISKWGIIENSNIQYYKPNCGFVKHHCERTCFENSERHLVFMTYLNDIRIGGETEFYYQKVKIKPKKGKTLIWPADWTHTHRGIVSPKEEKYIITGWLSFVQDKSINNNY